MLLHSHNLSLVQLEGLNLFPRCTQLLVSLTTPPVGNSTSNAAMPIYAELNSMGGEGGTFVYLSNTGKNVYLSKLYDCNCGSPGTTMIIIINYVHTCTCYIMSVDIVHIYVPDIKLMFELFSSQVLEQFALLHFWYLN